MRRAEGWAVFIVMATGAAFLVFTAARTIGQVLAFQDSSGGPTTDTAGWTPYHNGSFNFDFSYPPEWQLSTAGLSAQTPFIQVGNPLSGLATYAVDVFIENNPDSLSSGEYVHQLLATDRAQDAANAKSGPAPQVTPQFQKSFVTNAGSATAYELSGVFEFDHNAERIYVAHGNIVLRFDFPVKQENPNISLPVANNAIAHTILGTLTFIN